MKNILKYAKENGLTAEVITLNTGCTGARFTFATSREYFWNAGKAAEYASKHGLHYASNNNALCFTLYPEKEYMEHKEDTRRQNELIEMFWEFLHTGALPNVAKRRVATFCTENPEYEAAYFRIYG